jgi:hypothetical protein
LAIGDLLTDLLDGPVAMLRERDGLLSLGYLLTSTGYDRIAAPQPDHGVVALSID